MKKYYICFFIFVSVLTNALAQSKPLDISNVLLNFNNYQIKSEKNLINGYAGLDSNALIFGQNLFPSFSTQPDGTIWAKSGSTFAPLSGGLSISPSGISSKGVIVGNLTPATVGVGLSSSSNSDMVIRGGASNKIYFAPGSVIGLAASNSYNSYSWKIDISSGFSLPGGSFGGDISLNSNKILNAKEISGSTLKIDLNNSILDSGSSSITLSTSNGVFVPNISPAITSGGYALNVDSANTRYVKLNSPNIWTQPQTFSSTVLFSSPLSIANGGTGTNSLQALKTSPGINSLPSGTNLNQFSTLTATQDAVIIGETVGGSVQWSAKSAAQAKTQLGLQVGLNIQKYSPYLQAISDSATIPSSTVTGERYFFVLNGGTNTFERSTFTNLKSYLSISNYGSSLMSSANVNAAQSILQIVPGSNVQSYSPVLSSLASSTYIGSTSFSTLGNVTVGKWNATKIAPAYGGTGSQSIPGPGQVLIGNSSGTYTTSFIDGKQNQIIITEGSGSINISTPQDIAQSSSPTFTSLTLSQVNGTAPLIVSSSTVVNNLNADLLDGYSSSSFQLANSTLTSVANGNYTGNQNLNTLGNVTTGTWSASTIEVSKGGTGATNAAAARTNLGVSATGSDTNYPLKLNNLSDLGNVTVARTNLGVTATGLDPSYPLKSNNLSDLGNVTVARTNLGVTATGMDSTYLKVSNNLSDLGNSTTARTNLGLGNGMTTNKTFTDGNGTTHTITIINGIITDWTP